LKVCETVHQDRQ
jgi:hypothetical protein